MSLGWDRNNSVLSLDELEKEAGLREVWAYRPDKRLKIDERMRCCFCCCLFVPDALLMCVSSTTKLEYVKHK